MYEVTQDAKVLAESAEGKTARDEMVYYRDVYLNI